MNRLDLEQKNVFEQHYFNCRSCFSKLKAREELITIIKTKGESIFTDDIEVRKTSRITLWERLFTHLSPKRLAFYTISLGMVLVLVFTFFPSKETAPPEFRLDDPDLVRGRSITLLTDALPALFKWENLGENIEYKLTIFDQDPFWETKTKDTFIFLPENIRSKMIPGTKYYWQVKAYSHVGTLIARSKKAALPTEIQK